MSWYKLAQEQQQDNWQNILKGRQPGTSSNPSGILVSFQDYQKLKGFGPKMGPTDVFDKDTNRKVWVIHGGLDPNGNFAFSDGKNGYVSPEDKDWAQKLGVNENDFIIACYEGTAPPGAFNSVTKYQGKLILETPQNVQDPSQDVRVNITGG